MESLDTIMSLAKRRGFFWNAYELYGGVAGFLVWGPNGTVLKRRIIDNWRKTFLNLPNFTEIETPIIAPEKVFSTSGHLSNFKDIMVKCKKCKKKFNATKLLNQYKITNIEINSINQMKTILKNNDVPCPECKSSTGNPSEFLTMFKTTIGPSSERIGLTRPETAQGMFTEFKNVYISQRKKLPLGIAQIGKSMRNEISPRQGPIRLREFDMMEIELFYDPLNAKCHFIKQIQDYKINILTEEKIKAGEEKLLTLRIKDAINKGYVKNEWLAYFMALSSDFFETLGIKSHNQRFKEKLPEERAHYSNQTFDQEIYLSSWGWIEVAGHADRTNYDLNAHNNKGKLDLTAERILKNPKEKTIFKIQPNYINIKNVYPDKIAYILKNLNNYDNQILSNTLKKDGFITITDSSNSKIKLTNNFFIKEKIIEKINVERFIPYVIEPSFGLDRIAYSIIESCLIKKEDRLILSISPKLAPVHVGVFPIVSKSDFIKKSKKIKDLLIKNNFSVIYEENESIGKRYARADEIGIPIIITIDGQSLEDNTVTIRDRNSWKQIRIHKSKCKLFLTQIISGKNFDNIKI